jgi:hypothetical protein
MLAQLMREAAEDAREANAKATQRYFEELRQVATMPMNDHEFFMNNIDETFMVIYGYLCGLAEMMIYNVFRRKILQLRGKVLTLQATLLL